MVRAVSVAEVDQAANVYQVRFDAAIRRVRDIAHLRSTGPATRNMLGEVADELASLRRDLTRLGDRPLAAVAEVHHPAWEGRKARSGDGRRKKRREVYPEDRDGERWCPTHDNDEGAWLPEAEFAFKDKDKTHRKARCQECILDYQRQRYVRVGFKVVTVEVEVGDACLSHKCPECGGKFEVGQRVQGENVKHERCPT